MKPILDIRLEVVRLIETKRCHFCSFRKIANHRGTQVTRSKTKPKRQFKTEKWLQAELVHYFWSKGVSVIPEYAKKEWDLCIERPNGQGNFLLAIKCLADSDQSAKGDFDVDGGVRKDMEDVGKLHSTQGALLLILPLDEKDQKRKKYTQKMLKYIEQHLACKTLTMKKDPIPFVLNGDEGVLIVWIEPK